jgi:uncharacterized LabA/DUF88 family protein
LPRHIQVNVIKNKLYNQHLGKPFLEILFKIVMKDTTEIITHPENITISQTVAILIDGNNIERSIHSESDNTNTMLNLDAIVPKLLVNRGLSRLVYFREGKHISNKLQERLHNFYHGSVRACHKSADIPLSIIAIQLANKVDTIIIMSGDSDYIELVRHLKSEGVRVEIAAVLKTTSQLLKDEADHYHEITREDWFTLPEKRKQSRKMKTKKSN